MKGALQVSLVGLNKFITMLALSTQGFMVFLTCDKCGECCHHFIIIYTLY